MKIPKPSTRGSFGIPEEIRPENLRRGQEGGETLEGRSADGSGTDPEFSPSTMGVGEEEDEGEDSAGQTPDATPQEKASPTLLSPMQKLKKIGIDLSGEDFNRLIFKGYIEKPLKLSVNPITREPVMATFRTLTPGEYDELDECLAEECSDLRVTREGAEQRRSSWTLAFSLIAIDGKQFVKPVMKKDPDLAGEMVDTKATAKLRKKYIRSLNTQLVNKALNLFDTFTVNLGLIVEDPDATFFGKP